MYEPLIDLIAFDRLVEMVGHDRLRALVERNLAAADLFDALRKGDGVDREAVRAALAALPAAGPEAGSETAVRGNSFAVAGELNIHLVVAPEGAPLPRQPDFQLGAELTPTQVTWKNEIQGHRSDSGKAATGFCFASVTTPPASDANVSDLHSSKGFAWRERYVLREVDAWLEKRGDFVQAPGGQWTVLNSEQLAHDEWMAAIKALESESSTTPLYTMVADFRYGELPDPDALPAGAGSAAPKGTIRRHFELTGPNAAAQGYLLQDVEFAGNSRIVTEHWSLPGNYVGPRTGAPLSITIIKDSAPTLTQFITKAHDKGHRWYVPVVYGVQQILGKPAGIESIR